MKREEKPSISRRSQPNEVRKKQRTLAAIYQHMENKGLAYIVTCTCLGTIAGALIGRHYDPETTCSLYEVLGSAIGCTCGFAGSAFTLQELKEDLKYELGKLEDDVSH